MKTFVLFFCLLTITICSRAQPVVRDVAFNFNRPTSNENVRSIAVMSDLRSIIGGQFFTYDGQAYELVARLKKTGDPDPTFTSPLLNDRVDAVAVQPWDNKVLIGGSFTTVNGVNRSCIARLNVDGSLDMTFNSGTGVTGTYDGDLRIWSIVVLDDPDPSKRRIIIGGHFQYYNGFKVGNRGAITQLLEDGTRDVSYNPQVSDGWVYAMTLDKQNRLVIGGEFWKVGSTDIRRIARINRDGTCDLTFNHHGGWGPYSSVTAVAVTSDDKIMMGGYFTKFNDTLCRGMARLMPDGAFDTTFKTGAGLTGGVSSNDIGTEARTFLEMDLGRIVVGGNFRFYNGIASRNIVRVLSNGDLDASFDIGTGFNDMVMSLKFQGLVTGDRRILAGGYFTSYRGEVQGSTIRLFPTWPLPGGFLYVNGSRNQSSVSLKWKVDQAETGDRFVIYRGSGIVNMQKISEHIVAALATQNEYTSIDHNAPSTKCYYKIEHIRNDRVVNVGKIIAIGGTDRPLSFSATIFPNPAKDVMNIRTNTTAAKEITMRLYDVLSRLILSKKFTAEKGVNIFSFPFNELQKGTYYLVLSDEEGKHLAKQQVQLQ